ncbi:transcription factor bHLH133-like [Musa acuminata AAA Group]|uniref:transcription factor bHLH133-like n=1 Tax=Musa acuminata AAA Group TaxID=214697 RepID=UPI0031D0E58A
MNGGSHQISLVQRMMGGSPSLWTLNNLMPPSQEMSAVFASSSTSSSPSSSSSLSSLVIPKCSKPASFIPVIPCRENQDLPVSWSQLLLTYGGGLVEEEDKCTDTPYSAKRMENWKDQTLYTSTNTHMVDVKREDAQTGHAYHYGKDQEAQAARSSWSRAVPASSPRSCVTTSFSSNMLEFFSDCKGQRKHHQFDHSAECNSNDGVALKKARVQASSAQSLLKVRKEKLGDRISALHQLVSPFGKTDTASVLLEAIGYIRFLHSQIEALSSPYLRSGSRNTTLSDADDEPKNLRSRGLCLVPVSFILDVGNHNGADFWAHSFGMGFR